MRQIWLRIEAWLDSHVPSGANVLCPGASSEEIAATERALQVCFPWEVRASFQLHDGQHSSGPWLMWGWELLPLAHIRHQWGIWKGLLDEGAFRDLRSATHGGTVEEWWHLRWVPLTHD